MNKVILPGLPGGQKLIRPQRCETCKNGDSNGKTVSCRARPPQVCVLGSPQGPLTVTAFPTMQLTEWCAEWRSKLNGNSHDAVQESRQRYTSHTDAHDVESVSIIEVADWLHPASARWRAIGLFRAYFDESGTSGGSTITAIAGYVATKDAWASVEKLWREELALLAERGVKTFHMHECIVGEGEYALVEEFHRLAHIKRLSEILRDADIHAIGVWVDNADWAEVVKDDSFLTTFPTPYDLCFEHTVRWLRGWSKKRADGELVAPMFAYHPEYSPRTVRVYGSQDWYQDALGPLAFDFPKRVIPLQTADFIVNQTRYDAHHIGYDELTFSNATAKNGAHMIRGYTEQGLSSAMKRFAKNGTIF
jgi:hypothetical protein